MRISNMNFWAQTYKNINNVNQKVEFKIAAKNLEYNLNYLKFDLDYLISPEIWANDGVTSYRLISNLGSRITNYQNFDCTIYQNGQGTNLWTKNNINNYITNNNMLKIYKKYYSNEIELPTSNKYNFGINAKFYSQGNGDDPLYFDNSLKINTSFSLPGKRYYPQIFFSNNYINIYNLYIMNNDRNYYTNSYEGQFMRDDYKINFINQSTYDSGNFLPLNEAAALFRDTTTNILKNLDNNKFVGCTPIGWLSNTTFTDGENTSALRFFDFNTNFYGEYNYLSDVEPYNCNSYMQPTLNGFNFIAPNYIAQDIMLHLVTKMNRSNVSFYAWAPSNDTGELTYGELIFQEKHSYYYGQGLVNEIVVAKDNLNYRNYETGIVPDSYLGSQFRTTEGLHLDDINNNLIPLVVGYNLVAWRFCSLRSNGSLFSYDLANSFTFNYKYTNKITFYNSFWYDIPEISLMAELKPQNHTIRLFLNAWDNGVPYSTITCPHGELIYSVLPNNPPAAISPKLNKFNGWTTDRQLNNKINSNTRCLGTLNLYADWIGVDRYKINYKYPNNEYQTGIDNISVWIPKNRIGNIGGPSAVLETIMPISNTENTKNYSEYIAWKDTATGLVIYPGQYIGNNINLEALSKVYSFSVNYEDYNKTSNGYMGLYYYNEVMSVPNLVYNSTFGWQRKPRYKNDKNDFELFSATERINSNFIFPIALCPGHKFNGWWCDNYHLTDDTGKIISTYYSDINLAVRNYQLVPEFINLMNQIYFPPILEQVYLQNWGLVPNSDTYIAVNTSNDKNDYWYLYNSFQWVQTTNAETKKQLRIAQTVQNNSAIKLAKNATINSYRYFITPILNNNSCFNSSFIGRGIFKNIE